MLTLLISSAKTLFVNGSCIVPLIDQNPCNIMFCVLEYSKSEEYDKLIGDRVADCGNCAENRWV
jgi:hypothetical protein